jgi:hypothetical protein
MGMRHRWKLQEYEPELVDGSVKVWLTEESFLCTFGGNEEQTGKDTGSENHREHKSS